MNQTLTRLAERRAVLVAQAALQRQALAETLAPWRRPLSLADQGLAVLHFVKRHPAWIVGSALVPGALRAAPVGKWLRRGWLTWQIARRLTGRTPRPERMG